MTLGSPLPNPDSLTVNASSSEVVLSGPGQVILHASTSEAFVQKMADQDVSIILTLNAAGTVQPVILAVELKPQSVGANVTAKWGFSLTVRTR